MQDEGSRPYKFYKFHKMRAQGPTRPGVQTATESNSMDFLLENIADILTKHVNSEDIRVHLHKTGQTITRNRHEIAPAEDS